MIPHENVYYNPRALGLTMIGDIDRSDGYYQFDMLALWFDGKQFYWAADSGCSCPSPFEWVTMDTIDHGSLKEFKSYAKTWANEFSTDQTIRVNSELQDLLLRAKALIA